MNVRHLKQMTVMLTRSVTTQKDRTSVAVIVDIRVMGATAAVNLFRVSSIAYRSKSITAYAVVWLLRQILGIVSGSFHLTFSGSLERYRSLYQANKLQLNTIYAQTVT